MTINERFAELLRIKNISIRDAAQLLTKSEPYIRKLMRPGESFGIEPVLLILNSIEGLNPDWLLRGKGEMFAEKKNALNDERLTKLIDTIGYLQNTVNEQAKELSKLKEEKHLLMAQLAMYKNEPNIV